MGRDANLKPGNRVADVEHVVGSAPNKQALGAPNQTQAWDSELRGADSIARYGGEEFVVILPDCTEDQAQPAVERLRAVAPEGQTCSAGLARWDFVESAEDLLERADAAMYEAKGQGRDRIICA